MKINFLAQKHACQYTSKKCFGIIDPIPARIDEDNPNQWIARVNNPRQYKVKFVPVDKAMDIKDEHGQEKSSCEGILFYPHPYHSTIIFLELKEVRRGTSGGKGQLISTIELFAENHDLSSYRRKQAYIANRKHPHFKISRRTECQEFLQRYGVRLFLQSEINLI